MRAKIGSCSDIEKIETPISYTDLAAFPLFLRFDEVTLIYDGSERSNRQICEWFGAYLQALKPVLNDANLIYFAACVDRYNNPCDFKSDLQLIDHLSNTLLPICDSSRCYQIVIEVNCWLCPKRFLMLLKVLV